MDNGTQKAVQRQRMGILLCEQNFRDVWIRNKSVQAEIGQILRTHTHTHTRAAKLVVEISTRSSSVRIALTYPKAHIDGRRHYFSGYAAAGVDIRLSDTMSISKEI